MNWAQTAVSFLKAAAAAVDAATAAGEMSIEEAALTRGGIDAELKRLDGLAGRLADEDRRKLEAGE